MSNHRRLPVHVGDEEKSTRHLTPAQYGCYARLRMAAWARGGVDADPGKLARIAGCRIDVWKRLAPDVLAMFEERDGMLVHAGDEALLERRERQAAPAPELPLEPPSGAGRIHNSCGLNSPEKGKDFKGRAPQRTCAAPNPEKTESLVGIVGDSAARTAGRAGAVRPPAVARAGDPTGPPKTDQGLGRSAYGAAAAHLAPSSAVGAPSGAVRPTLSAPDQRNAVVPIIAPKPFAQSRRRPRDGPEALQDVLDRLMRHATGRGG